MKKILFASILGIIALGAGANTFSQKVALRGTLAPACTPAASSLKYADIYADGNIAVMGSYQCRGVFIMNISNPDAPTLYSHYNPGANLQFLEAIVIGNRGYFGTGNTGGVHIVDLTNPASPQLLGIVNAANGGGYPTIHEMMVFDQGGSRYLLENSNSTGSTTLRIIDVTNPAAAVLKWSFTSGAGGWVHAMHIRGTRMYLSVFNSPRVDIYDIPSLATQAPAFRGSVQVGGNTNHSSWTDETGNFLYSAREFQNGDLRVYNVSDPAQPLLVKTLRAADLNINAITPHNPVVMGNRLYVAWYQAGTQVFDISTPSDPVKIGQYDTYLPEFAPSEEEQKIVDNAEPWDIMCGSDSFGNGLPTQYGGNWAVYPFLGEDKVLLGDLASGLFVVDVTPLADSSNFVSDFDGDGKTDFSVFRPTNGDWLVEKSSDGTQSTLNWGLTGDVITPGDYDGDGKTDHAIFRPSTGTWWFVMSSNGTRPAVQFGAIGDIPVPGDYDGDGKTDVAVWRPSNGVWYINQSSGGVRYHVWGLTTDVVLTGDHDGDGTSDMVVWRPSNGAWYVLLSSSGTAIISPFGTAGDKPLFADFDGDGRSDLSVYRPSTGIWYRINSSNGAFVAFQFGIAEDMPVPADYDGDGKSDVAVFRPSSNIWYRLNSTNSGLVVREFGTTGDRPSPSSVQPQ